jgi:hypothetical protein
MSGANSGWKQALLVTILISVAYAGAQTPPHHCEGPLNQRLLKAAVNAPDAAKDNGTLYGMQRWRKRTGRSYVGLKFPGLFSCAYTVSAIFQEACRPIGEIPSVNGIDAALVKWQKMSCSGSQFAEPSLDLTVPGTGTSASRLAVTRRWTMTGGLASQRRVTLIGHARHSHTLGDRLRKPQCY